MTPEQEQKIEQLEKEVDNLQTSLVLYVNERDELLVRCSALGSQNKVLREVLELSVDMAEELAPKSHTLTLLKQALSSTTQPQQPTGGSATEGAKIAYHPPTNCCNYICSTDIPYPVMWNQFSKVIQCHNCGQVFIPTNDDTALLDWLEKYFRQETAYSAPHLKPVVFVRGSRKTSLRTAIRHKMKETK